RASREDGQADAGPRQGQRLGDRHVLVVGAGQHVDRPAAAGQRPVGQQVDRLLDPAGGARLRAGGGHVQEREVALEAGRARLGGGGGVSARGGGGGGVSVGLAGGGGFGSPPVARGVGRLGWVALVDEGRHIGKHAAVDKRVVVNVDCRPINAG